MSTSLVTPCLWFEDRLEEAATFYAGLFPRSRVGDLARTPDGQAVAGEFELDGLRFRALAGRPPRTRFTEAVSFSIACADQAEVDRYWDALTEDGEEGRCGWLTDRFGLSWQVVPTRLGELLGDPDPARARAATEAMLQMTRLVVADLEAAAGAAGAAGGPPTGG